MCSVCKVWVGSKTEHCLSCHRCTVEMDHHSQLINNCISLRNMRNYLRMNICFCLAVFIMMIESAILFTTSFFNNEVAGYIINQWTIMLLIILTFICFIFSLVNTLYTCYIHYIRKTSRLEHRFRETDSNNSDLSDEEDPEEADKEESN